MWHNWLRDGLRTQGSRRPVGNSRSQPRLEPLEERHLLNAAVSVIAQVAQASEVGPSPAIFRFTRTGDLSSPLQANFSLGGTALPGVDYQVMDKTAVFDAGSNTAYVTVLPRNDAQKEGNETVTLTLTSGAGYNVGTTASATATIADAYVPGFPGVFNTPAPALLPGVSNTPGPALPVALTYLEAKTGGGQLQIKFALQINTVEQPFVEFYLDTDQNPTTGDQRANHVAGQEYRVSVPVNLGLANYTLYQEPLTPGQLQEQTVAQNVGVQNQNGLYVLNIPLSELVSKPGNPPPTAVDVFAFAYGYSDGLNNDMGQGDRLPKYGAIDSSTGEVVVRDPVRTRIAYASAAPGSASNGPYNLQGALFTTIADQFNASLSYSQAINPSYATLQGELVLDADRSLATGDIPMTGDITQGTGIPTWGGDTMLNFSIGGIQGPSFTLIHDLFYDPFYDPSANFGGSDNDGRWVYNGSVLTLSSSLSTFEPFEQASQGAQYGSLRVPTDGDMYVRLDMVNDLDVPYDSLPSAPGVVDTATGQALQPLTWDPTRTVSWHESSPGNGDFMDITQIDREVVQNNLVIKIDLGTLPDEWMGQSYVIYLDTDVNASPGINYEVLINPLQGWSSLLFETALVNLSDQTTVSHDAWVNAETHPIEQSVPGSLTVTVPLEVLKNLGPKLGLDVAACNPYGSWLASPSWLVVQTAIPANLPPTVATPASATPSPVTGTTTTLSVLGGDDGGEANLKYTWAATTLPAGASAPTFSVNGTNAAKKTVATFSKAGTYGFTVTIADAGGLTTTSCVNVTVNQTLTSIGISPASVTVKVGGTQQFAATAKDQFGNALATQPSFTWAATAGTITASGLFTAPKTTGSVTVTATSGSFKGSAGVNVTNLVLNLQDQALANLVQSLDADGSISRLDMIQILDSIGSEDGVVDAAEFGDLKTILNNAAMLKIPGYVDVLAGDVVNGNPANAYFQGQVLGNLAAGSSASQLKELVSKWFLGADHPAAYYYDQYNLYHQCQYSSVAGSLFVNGPAYTDMHQGELGDCYLISALGSLAKSSPAVIQNMIIDNGDNTWTVRFYANGTPDYVTVDRMLPTENGNLVFDDYGASPSNAGNVLWIPLVEKAYAEWNETGKEGRDGQNSYWSIAGGASGDVYTQILGHGAQYYTFPGFVGNGYMPGTEQTMINAISSNEAVTIGTYQAGNGLYASHVYMVVGYTMATDTFQLYNPWGVDQPGPLTWTQLSADCDAFWVANTSGTVPIGNGAQAPPLARSIIALPAVPIAGALEVPSGRVSVLIGSPSPSATAMTDHVASPMAKSSIAKTPAAFPTAGTDAFGVSLARVSRPHKTLTKLSPLAVDELFLDTDFLAG